MTWVRLFFLKQKHLNYYLFYNDYEIGYTTYINHARWYRCLRSGGLRVGEKPECPEETHLSDLVTTLPSHMSTPGIEPRSQR